jgi:hypothetical protein
VRRAGYYFVLSYMTEREVELWVDVYMEEALRMDYWGLWEGFTEKLARTFMDEEEGR